MEGTVTNELKAPTTATLLFNQNAIKCVRLTDDQLIIWFGDSSEPIVINNDDVLYEFHKKNFDVLIAANLNPAEKAE